MRTRDRIAVGAGGRVSQQIHQSGFDIVGDHVLPAARLAVHLVPFQPDDIDEEALGQAVLAHDLLRQGLPTLSQREPAAIPGHVPVLSQAVQHLGDRRCGPPQPLRDAGLNHRHTLLRERQHGLEVLLDGRVVFLGLMGGAAVLSHGNGRKRAARRGRGCGRRSRRAASVKPVYSTGMTGQSSGRGMWVTPKECHSTMSVSTMGRSSAVQVGKPAWPWCWFG